MNRFPKIGAAIAAIAVITAAVPAAAKPAAATSVGVSSFLDSVRTFYRNIRPF